MIKSVGTTEHEFFEERLSAYLDGELTPREHESVEHHLRTCSACQWEMETLAQTIQWTKELPALQVPRVFTVPVPAEPARSSIRRWNFLPVLQGATALIAVLLVFAVVGDFMLGGRLTENASDAVYEQEVASGEVEAPTEVEVAKIAEAPAAVEPEREVEEVVVQTVVETVIIELEVAAEPAVAAEPTEEPPTEGVSPTLPLVNGEAVVAEATPSPPADRATWESPEEETTEEASVPETATEEGEAVPRVTEEDAVAGGGEPSMLLTAPSPSISATESSSVATELAMAPATEQDESKLGPSGETGVNWLRVVEVSLGAVLVLMAAATIVLTIERRRAR